MHSFGGKPKKSSRKSLLSGNEIKILFLALLFGKFSIHSLRSISLFLHDQYLNIEA